ncbi:MAG: GTPase ObgE, partial [Planctomyces sp.]
RPEILVVTKAELTDAATCAELLRETTGREVLLVSAVTGRGLPELNRQIIQRLAELKAADAAVSADVSPASQPAVTEPLPERPE